MDAHGQNVLSDFRLAGVNNIKRVKVSSLYKLKGELTTQEIETIAKELLTDPVTQEYNVKGICHSEAKPKNLFFSAQNQNEILRSAQNDSLSKVIVIEVWLKPGVTDSVGENVVKGIKDLGLKKEVKAFSGSRYVFECDLAPLNFETAVKKILVNPLIHDYKIT